LGNDCPVLYKQGSKYSSRITQTQEREREGEKRVGKSSKSGGISMLLRIRGLPIRDLAGRREPAGEPKKTPERRKNLEDNRMNSKVVSLVDSETEYRFGRGILNL